MASSESGLSGIEIRPLAAREEFEATLALQRKVWGFDETDLFAPRLFEVAQRVGGSCLGAFLDGELVGYSLALAAFKPGLKAYWHSHMTGVDPALQGSGIGRALKLRQREEALAAGLNRIEWTFDPLQSGNAHFNIQILGARVAEYLPDFYGITSSALHGARPTDRLVAAWHLLEPRVLDRIEGRSPVPGHVEDRIEIPIRVSELAHDDTLRVLERVREAFRSAFGSGLEVVGFEREPGIGIYQLGRRCAEPEG